MTSRKHFFIAIVFLFVTQINSQIMYYRQLPEFALSAKFMVEVAGKNNVFKEIFTYQMEPSNTNQVTKMEHFTSFGFEPDSGAVTVRVSLKSGTALTDADIELVNKTYADVTTSFVDGKFLIKTPSSKKHLFVRLKKDYSNPLMVFADPIKMSPYPANAKVYTFAASSTPYVQTAQYDRFTIPNDVDVVVVEDGALVKGTIHTDAARTKPVILTGRGVVIGNGGILNGATNIPYNAIVINDGVGNIIEGIFVIKSRHFSVDLGANGVVDNVKMYGYESNNDGVVAYDNSIIKNCFFKVQDDNIKVYYDNLTIQNCNFYAQINGGIFQYAWSGEGPTRKAVIKDCEVLAVEYTYCGDPALNQGGTARSFINLHTNNNLGTTFGDQTYSNILIQGQLLRFISINGAYQNSVGLNFDLKLDNVTVVNKPSDYSLLYTQGTNNIDLVLRNVKLGGSYVTTSEFKTIGTAHIAIANNSSDVTAPVVSITQPLANTTSDVKDSLTVSANVSDASGIFRVGLYVNDAFRSFLYKTPYSWKLRIPIPGTYEIKVVALDAVGNINADSVNIKFEDNKNWVPAPWKGVDIGNPTTIGGTSYSSGIYTIYGAGKDIWDTKDQFQFLYQPIVGSRRITAQILSLDQTDNWSKSGIMIRETLQDGSKHAAIYVTGNNGTSFQYRDNTGGISTHITPANGIKASCYVRMIRDGNLFRGLTSKDGTTWTEIGRITIDMKDSVYTGIAVTSHNESFFAKSDVSSITLDYTTGIGSTKDNTLPTEYELGQNYPNPFNPTTKISFSIPKSSFVSLKVYNMLGQLVDVLLNKEINAGNYSVNFDATHLTSGVYLYKIDAEGYSVTKKMLLMK